MRKYLVCRVDAMHTPPQGAQLNSSYFPVVVTYKDNKDHLPSDVARKACEQIFPGYLGKHKYVVVPLDDAKIVEFFEPKPQLDYTVYSYC